MLYTKDGTPLPDVLRLAALRVAERRAYRRPTNYVRNVDGERVYRVVHDRLGDPIRVFRAVHRHRSGAGYLERQRVSPRSS
jgi:hypothetical protein